jgi:hypothetical protein
LPLIQAQPTQKTGWKGKETSSASKKMKRNPPAHDKGLGARCGVRKAGAIKEEFSVSSQGNANSGVSIVRAILGILRRTVFEALCPWRKIGAELFLPIIATEAG